MSICYEAPDVNGNIKPKDDGHVFIDKSYIKRHNINQRRTASRQYRRSRTRQHRVGNNRKVFMGRDLITGADTIEINIKNILDKFDNKEARRKLIEKLAEIDGYVCDFSGEDSKILISANRRFIGSLLEEEPDFSANSPAKWQNRKDRSEDLIDFIRREYGPWIGKNLLQEHIRKYDMPLYYALANMKSKNKKDILKEVGIPSKKELTKEFANGADIIEDPEIKAAIRLRERIRMRQRRSQNGKLSR